METTWVVACPNRHKTIHKNRVHAWLLPRLSVDKIGNVYNEPLIECYVCRCTFSLLEGVKEAFCMHIPAIIEHFANSTVESGVATIKLGWTRPVKFPKKFQDIPSIYLTPFSQYSSSVVSGKVDRTGFQIFSSKALDAPSDDYEISWTAYGMNEEDLEIPVWRRLISVAKKDQLRRDFRLEIVNLESAFEIFVTEYLKGLLQEKGLEEETIDWILRRGIEEVMSTWFKEATGVKANQKFGKLHERWVRDVKKLRNGIIHRGRGADENKSNVARSIVIDYIFSIDPTTVELFRIKTNTPIGNEKPTELFGVGTITVGTTTAKIDLTLGELTRELEMISPLELKYNESLKRHDYANALLYCNKALEIAPNHTDSLRAKILSLNQLELYDEAIQTCVQVLDMKPDDIFALYQSNNALHHLGRYEEALTSCSRVLEIDPYHIAALCDKGLNLHKLGRLEEALKEFNSVLSIYPADVPTLINKGAILSDQGNLRQAIKCWNKALELEPSNPYAMTNLENALKRIDSSNNSMP